ncbi:MAG: MFS transporter [Gammaproteobacteria bacterium]|nr:MFS transporter [Gammaproteobacteria bacterium]
MWFIIRDGIPKRASLSHCLLVPATMIRSTLYSVVALLLAVGLLMVGTGMFNTYIILRGSQEGFSTPVISLIGSIYYLGLLVGTLRCGPLINRVGHIRAFASFATLGAVSILSFPFYVEPWFWLVLRAVLGFCSAGLYMVVESWLNYRATGETRGTVFSVYMMISYIGLGGGQLLLGWELAVSQWHFMLAAILIALALLPVTLTSKAYPAPVEPRHLSVVRLYQVSPVAVVGCVCAGLVNGAIYAMGAVFAEEIGLSLTQISQFMGLLIISGLFLQLPIGRLSDRFDRRDIIRLVGLVSTLFAFTVVLILSLRGSPETSSAPSWLLHWIAIPAAAACYSAFHFTIYPLCVAHANDYVEADERVEASGGLVLAFSIGAVIGPILAAAMMELSGPTGLFMFNGTVSLLILLFTGYRRKQRSWAGIADKEPFVSLPDVQTTPNPVELDPRIADWQLSLDLPLPDDG